MSKKYKLGFLYSVLAIVACLTVLGLNSNSAEARTLKDIGLTQNDVKNFTPQQIKDLLDSSTVNYDEEAEKAGKFSAADEVMLPNTVSCFDYYSFGSVQANFSPAVSMASAGTSITFSGKIVNKNSYPIVGGKLIVKIFKISGNGEKDINGPDVVDEFDVKSDLSIAANGSVPVTFDWMIPVDAEKGRYEAVAFFTVADKFNMLGLTFTDDIIGNTAAFSVDGIDGAIRFDKAKVAINGNKFYFASYPPRIETDETVITAELVNTTSKAESVPVSWKVYSWDAQEPSNLLKEYRETVQVPANSRIEIKYSIKDKNHPIYYIRIESKAKGVKSILGVRYVRQDAEKFRINFPAVNKFPLVKGEETELFSCFHAVTEMNPSSEGRLVLSLENMQGKTISSHEYKGPVTGAMMGTKSSFVPKRDYDRFNLKAELYRDGKLVDSAVMKYDCKAIDPTKCSEDSMPLGAIISAILAALAVIGVIFFARKRKAGVIAAMVLIFGFSLAFGIDKADATSGEVRWEKSDFPAFSTGWGGRTTKLENIHVTVTYKSEITKESGEVLSGGETLPVGTKLNLKFTPHSSNDIFWVGTGSAYDSPYGEWRSSSITTAPAGCQEKDFLPVYKVFDGSTGFAGAINRIRTIQDARFFPLVFAPPQKSLSDLQNLSCGAVSAAGVSSCTVTGDGPVSAKFNFAATSGNFYFSFIQLPESLHGLTDYSLLSPSLLSQCLTKSTPFGETLTLPAQSISFSFNGIASANLPPTTPAISGPTTGSPGQTYTFDFVSTDPESDKVKYGVNWANVETVNSWAPAPNADPQIAHATQGVAQSLTKSWATAGTYVIKALAQDINGAASGWGSHTIVISENSTTTPDCVPGAPGCASSCTTVPPVATGFSLSAGQCAANSNLTDFRLNGNGWEWKCQGDWQTVPETCNTACESGAYSTLTQTCAIAPDDLCTNISGTQTLAELYTLDANGRCVPNTGQIRYLRFNPDTTETSCPAYWDTQAPDPSLGFTMSCKIGNTPVGLSNLLVGGLNSFLFPVGVQHALTCNIAGNEDNIVVKTLTARSRCYRIGEVVEQ